MIAHNGVLPVQQGDDRAKERESLIVEKTEESKCVREELAQSRADAGQITQEVTRNLGPLAVLPQ